MTTITLPFGESLLKIEVPKGMFGEVVSPRLIEEVADPEVVIHEALDQPIGTAPLEQIVRPGQRVAVVIDDITRETPTHLMLPPLLERLTSVGVPRTDIKLVVALGTHRPMTAVEIEKKTGAAIAHEYEIVNVPSTDTSKFVYLGMASNNIPAWINRIVAEADVRIGVGSIIPHCDAGFGGGAKIILPGVCNDQTVDIFHARGVRHGNKVGLVENPLRHDLEHFVGERIGLEFILNAIPTRDGELYKCVAGHFLQAHRAGVGLAQDVFGVPVSRRYPLVISNSFPAEYDLWQCTKGVYGGEPMVSNGGTLILLSHCKEGITVHPHYADYMGNDPDELQAELDAGRVDDPNACAAGIRVSRIKQRINIGLVSPGLSWADAARMGIAYYDSVEQAISAEIDVSQDDAKVAVLTHGGFTIPVLGAG